MARPLALALALLTVSVTVLPLASSADDYAHCEGAVKGWADSVGEGDNGGDKLNLKDLLFFLHIPRTGGRTYFHCFLKKLYTNAQECPRSYDKLRFDPSHPDCTLVVSHDDYSLTSKLPRERTSVVTILRNPVDRVFSTYEFSVEVAARFLVHPNLTSAKTTTSRVLTKSRAVSTLDIWPWKYLVPWMREDLFARRDARGIDNVRSSKKINAYDVEDMVMPLHQYINDPVTHEIIHNGATFQITGLTNNSYFDGAHEVRHCVRKHPDLGRFVLQVAKNRLDRMLYVGLTEDHEESARLFAHMVGAQVLSQSGALKLDVQEDQPSGTDSHSSMLDPEDEETNEHMNSTHGWKNNEALNTTEDDHGKGNMTVGKLMETYEGCIAKLRKSQSSRRKISLKKVAEANFTKAARRHVPEAILNQIISLNSLDMELYEHAKNIFKQEHLMLKGQHPMLVQQKQLADQMVWSSSYKGQHPMVVQQKQLADQKEEIYEHAKNIFKQEHLMLKGQHPMVVQQKQLADQMVRSSSSYKGQHPMVVQQKQLADQKDWIDAICESWSCSTWWKVASFGLGIAVTTVFVVFAVTGRRTLKLKV